MKRIVFIDDEPLVLDGLRRMLWSMRSQWDMVFLNTAEEAWERLQHETFDAVVSDVCMSGMDGLQLLRHIRRDDRFASVAVVILTGEGNESIAVTAMKSGAQDYLVKGSITGELIERTIENAMADLAARSQIAEGNDLRLRLLEQLAGDNVELSQMSRIDSMTKLLNRGAWEEAIALEQERSEHNGRSFGVIMIDIDHFKRFNDAIGHQAGDECLCRVTQCIAQTTRAIDMVGRYGGEEFIILAPETDLDGVNELAERIRSAVWELNMPHPSSPTAERVTVSVGAAVWRESQWQAVVKHADEALYAAKDGGRNQVRCHHAILQHESG